MPKEMIESRYAGMTEVPSEATRMHVGWTKDLEQVEVGVLNEGIDSKLLGDPAAGWYVQLDRYGINRAIRALRKARDEAFGKDA
jgi:hypothetical protein